MELFIVLMIVIPVIIILVMRRVMRGSSPSQPHHSSFQEGKSGTSRSGGFWWLWGTGSNVNSYSGIESDYNATQDSSDTRKSADQSFDLHFDHSSGNTSSDNYSGDCSDSGGSGDCSDSGGGGDCGGGD